MGILIKPITECSNAKPKQTQITFDTQVKTAIFLVCCKRLLLSSTDKNQGLVPQSPIKLTLD